MLHTCFHALSRDPPHSIFEVDLVPGCAPSFTGSCRRDNQESEAQLGGHRGLGCCNRIESRFDFLIGQRSEVCLHLRHSGQGTIDGFTRRVGLQEAVRHCPFEDGSHTLTNPTGRLRTSCPYRGEDLQHLPAVYPVQGFVTQCRHSVTLQSLNPACDVPGIAPTGFVLLMDDIGGFPEGRHRRRVLFSHGITTLCDRAAVIRRLLASKSQAYGRISAQADFPSASVHGNAQDPRLSSRFADVKVQASAIGVTSRVPSGP